MIPIWETWDPEWCGEGAAVTLPAGVGSLPRMAQRGNFIGRLGGW